MIIGCDGGGGDVDDGQVAIFFCSFSFIILVFCCLLRVEKLRNVHDETDTDRSRDLLAKPDGILSWALLFHV